MNDDHLRSVLHKYEKHWPSLFAVILVPALGTWASALTYARELARAQYFGLPTTLVRIELGSVLRVSTVIVLILLASLLFSLRFRTLSLRLGFGAIFTLLTMGVLCGVLAIAYVPSAIWGGVGIMIASLVILATPYSPRAVRLVPSVITASVIFAITYLLGANAEEALISVVTGVVYPIVLTLSFRNSRAWLAGRHFESLPRWHMAPVLVAWVVVVSLVFSFAAGHATAKSQSEYFVIESEPNFVVVAIYDDRFILRELIETAGISRFGSRIKILTNQEISKSALASVYTGRLILD